ncbi:MAG: hypothetical protein ABFS30_13190 [Pseudomonadota bacterium]
MKKITIRAISRAAAVVVAMSFAGPARAGSAITNIDQKSYDLIKKCGGETEDWSIDGKAATTLNIPAGVTSCTVTVKKTGTSCTVKDGDHCAIQNGKISKR